MDAGLILDFLGPVPGTTVIALHDDPVLEKAALQRGLRYERISPDEVLRRQGPYTLLLNQDFCAPTDDAKSILNQASSLWLICDWQGRPFVSRLFLYCKLWLCVKPLEIARIREKEGSVYISSVQKRVLSWRILSGTESPFLVRFFAAMKTLLNPNFLYEGLIFIR